MEVWSRGEEPMASSRDMGRCLQGGRGAGGTVVAGVEEKKVWKKGGGAGVHIHTFHTPHTLHPPQVLLLGVDVLGRDRKLK